MKRLKKQAAKEIDHSLAACFLSRWTQLTYPFYDGIFFHTSALRTRLDSSGYQTPPRLDL